MIVEILTSGTSWNVPLLWGNGSNTVECIGAGGGGGGSWYDGGGHGLESDWAGAGAGGGAYAKKYSVALTRGGTAAYSIGVGGTVGAYAANGVNGGDTYFNGASLAAASVGAQGGRGGIRDAATHTVTGALGGQASSSIGDVTYSGGNGGNGSNFNAAGGGGGAAGPRGAGGNGSHVLTTGGTADGGNVAAAASGTYWEGTHGAGGGSDLVGYPSLTGWPGNYGGGGRGSKYTSPWGTDGAPGIIVISYTLNSPSAPAMGF